MNPTLLRRALAFLVLLAALVAPAAAQVFPFQIRIQQDDNVFSVENGSNSNINSKAVGKPATLHVTATYRGFATMELVNPPVLVGGASFSLTGIIGAPGTLVTGDTFKFDVTFTPTTSAAATAQVQLIYRETSTSNNPLVPPTVTYGLFVLNFVGTTPEFVASYLLPSEGNSIALADGSKLVFSPTPINTSSTVQVSIANRGSGFGKITGVTVSGAAFQPLGIPLFPLTLSGNTQFNFSIRYSPKELENSAGSLLIAFEDHILSVDLVGSSVGTTLVYQVTRGAQTSPVLPNQTIALDDASVGGDSSSVVIQVRNSGTADGVIGGISLTGAGFQLVDTPTLPVTLAPDGVTSFSISFTPTQPGQVRGRLRVGTDNFDLLATGLGSRLTFSYLTGSTALTVTPGGSVIFSPIQAGKKATTQFTVHNAGTSPATVASIGIQEPQTPFTITGQPSLPATLPPDASFDFTITYSPVTTGFATATLRIDSSTFGLSGSGTSPGPLPNYTLTGPSGIVQPVQQPVVALALASSYPVTVTGVLTLNVDPEGFTSDPAIQFSTGGRTANFTIPANTTQAMFGSSTQIRLQTGSVAARMSLTATFSLPGGVDITPTSPPSLQFSVASTAPILSTVQLNGLTANSFGLIITGIATSRSLTKLDFTVTPVASFNVATTKLTADLTNIATQWFTSAQSQSFGGLFQITIPFNISSSDPTASPVEGLASISVTATNEKGTSNTLSTALSAR